MPLKALSIQDPWAHAVAYWGKTTENRTWPTSHRGLIAIHASKKFDDAALGDPRIAEALTREGGAPALPYAPGAVIAVATLYDCHEAGSAACGEGGEMCSPWALRGQWHFRLRDVLALPEPVPCRGALALWWLPAGAENAVAQWLIASTGKEMS